MIPRLSSCPYEIADRIILLGLQVLFHKPFIHVESISSKCASPRVAKDTIPSRDRGSQITAITIPCDHAHLTHGMSPVATGSGGRPALRTAPFSRARKREARTESPNQKHSGYTEMAATAGNDRHYLKPELGLRITVIMNLN